MMHKEKFRVSSHNFELYGKFRTILEQVRETEWVSHRSFVEKIRFRSDFDQIWTWKNFESP